MLAIAIQLSEYMSNGGNEAEMKINQKNWMDRNKKELQMRPNEQDDDRTPLQVLATYCDRYGFDVDQVADEIDWQHFRLDGDEGESFLRNDKTPSTLHAQSHEDTQHDE